MNMVQMASLPHYYLKVLSLGQLQGVRGLPGCLSRRCRFDPLVQKIPWRRKWQLTLVILAGKSQKQRSLEGYSPWGHKEWDMTDHPHTHLKAYPWDSFCWEWWRQVENINQKREEGEKPLRPSCGSNHWSLPLD